MATVVQQYSAFPNVIALIGDVIGSGAAHNLNRGVVLDTLFTPSSPLGDLTGKVDFVICFNRNGGFPSAGGVDHSDEYNPRPLRGIINIPNMAIAHDSQVGNMAPLLGLLIHEIGHYWIGNSMGIGVGKIRTRTGMVDTPDAVEIWQALNRGERHPPYPIIGRQDNHWSPFIDGQNSPLEAGKYSEEQGTPRIGVPKFAEGDVQIRCEKSEGPEFHLSGPYGGTVTTRNSYSDLERWIMGDLDLPYETASTRLAALGKVQVEEWPSFRVMEPRWVFPLPFHVGLYLELEDGKRYYMGFLEGPDRLQLLDSVVEPAGVNFQLPTDPFDPHQQAGLRVIQDNSEVHCQIRVWKPQPRGCLLPWQPFFLGRSKPRVSCQELVGDVDLSQPSIDTAADPLLSWRTIGTIPGRIARMGVSMRTLGNGVAHVRMKAKLCSRVADQMQQVELSDLDADIPADGPRILDDGRFMMPYCHALGPEGHGLYRENADSHDAPKWTIESPDGDFVFGGVFEIDACSQVSWAGGCKEGKTMIGKMRRVKFNDYVLPDYPHNPKRIEEPHQGHYKVLVCAAALTQDDIPDSDIEHLDRVRRALDLYWPLIMNRGMNTLIDY